MYAKNSRKEFDSILYDYSAKGCGKDPTRKTTRRICDGTSIHIPSTSQLSAKTKTLHMSRFVVVFTSIKAFVLSLKEGGKVHQRHTAMFRLRDLFASGGDVYHTRREQREL